MTKKRWPHWLTGGLLAGVLLLSGLSPARAGQDQDQVVQKALSTVHRVKADTHFTRLLRDELRKARGVLIVPSLYKGGLLIGGQGGTGVLLVRDAVSGTWSYPVFQTLVGGSLGLQIGFESTTLLIILRTDKGVDAVLRDGFRFGGQTGLSVVSVGGSLAAPSGSVLNADIVAFSSGGVGAYNGLSLDGARVNVRDNWTASYYGRPVGSWDVLFGKGVVNHQADMLRHALTE